MNDTNEEEVINSTNDTEETVNDTVQEEETEIELETEVEDTESNGEDALRKQIATLQAQKEHWRKKAQITDKKVTTESTPTAPKKDIELSSIDTIALIRANVEDEDIKDVAEIAKIKGISIAEALKTSAVRAILAEKKEERTVANATNVSGQRRGTSRVSDETLLDRASKTGQVPESTEDIERLIEARRAAKRS